MTQDEAKTTQDEAKTTQDEAKTTHYSEIENAWKFCEKRSRCIEVIYKDKEGQTTLAKVHFNSKVCSITVQVTMILLFGVGSIVKCH